MGGQFCPVLAVFVWSTQLQTAFGPHAPDAGLGSSVICSHVWDVGAGGPAFQHPEEAWGRRAGDCPGNARAATWPGTVLSSVLGHGECAVGPAGPGGRPAGPGGQAGPPPGQTWLFGGSQGRSFEFGMLVTQSVTWRDSLWRLAQGAQGRGSLAASGRAGLEEACGEATGDTVSTAGDSSLGHSQARSGPPVAVLLPQGSRCGSGSPTRVATEVAGAVS